MSLVIYEIYTLRNYFCQHVLKIVELYEKVQRKNIYVESHVY